MSNLIHQLEGNILLNEYDKSANANELIEKWL